MAKKKSKAKAKANANAKVSKSKETTKVEQKLTLETLDAISSDDESDETSQSGEGNEKWDAESLALRKAIASGKFDKLLNEKENISENEEIEESSIGDNAESGDEKSSDEDGSTESEKDIQEQDADEDGSAESEKDIQEQDAQDSDDEENDEREGEENNPTEYNFSGRKAIITMTQKLLSRRDTMPWSENFCIIPSTPLPFAANSKDGNSVDIHDDLKRELAFYNMALQAVDDARTRCNEAGVPFSRPEDFFAEMIKSDDHMAKVKDRLIFETKKIDAVAQRKANKEQKLRAKEMQQNKIAEKSKKKKEHFDAINNWNKSGSQNRGSLTDDDEVYRSNLLGKKRMWTDRDGNLQDGPNKKRSAANKRYGFGGRRGRFKQNDPKSMNDMSSYNPKGNFKGLGQKSKGSAGSKRKGKRARDSARSR